MAFQSHHPSFDTLVGEKPIIECLLTEDRALFHEAGIFVHGTNELFVTSNRLRGEDGQQSVQISRVSLGQPAESAAWEAISCEDIVMGNGGVNYKDGILFCAQGGMQAPSGLYFMSLNSIGKTDLLVSGFYGRQFNSVNDVVVHSDGTIWFTDPAYGFEQGYRPKPQLPSQVYRFNPTDGSIRAVADGFGHPNGLCFSPDEQVLYVTDTDRVRGDGSIHDTCPSSIYSFDVQMIGGEPFLVNRRLFAMTENGIPDGIKCDTSGNVYSGCGDGLNVWGSGGVLLGKVLLDGGVANFCFGNAGEMFLLNETRLWRVRLAGQVRGALLDVDF